MALLTIKFEAFKNLSSRIMNKLTDFLTGHSNSTAGGSEYVGSQYEHWASAVRFRGLESVQTAIDNRDYTVPAVDTFVASELIGPELTKHALIGDDITQALISALDQTSYKFGASVGIKDNRYIINSTITLDNYTEIRGESKYDTIIENGNVFDTSGGFINAYDGVFSDLTFVGSSGEIMTIMDVGQVEFENCVFECYSTPSITLQPYSTVLFRDCDFIWKGAGATGGVIEANLTSGDIAPNIYATFAGCRFSSESDDVRFFKYHGFDSLSAATLGAWTGVMSSASKVRFYDCAFYQPYISDSANPIPLIEVWRHPNRTDVEILRMIVELIRNKFYLNRTYSISIDATMVNMFDNSYQQVSGIFDTSIYSMAGGGTPPWAVTQDVQIRSGYESTDTSVGGDGVLSFSDPSIITSDGVSSFSNIYSDSFGIEYGVSKTPPFRYYIAGGDANSDLYPLIYNSDQNGYMNVIIDYAELSGGFAFTDGTFI